MEWHGTIRSQKYNAWRMIFVWSDYSLHHLISVTVPIVPVPTPNPTNNPTTSWTVGTTPSHLTDSRTNYEGNNDSPCLSFQNRFQATKAGISQPHLPRDSWGVHRPFSFVFTRKAQLKPADSRASPFHQRHPLYIASPLTEIIETAPSPQDKCDRLARASLQPA